MTQKTYRTAQGKTVDLGALQLQNENVRAVGNMNVNARGDVIDGYNRPIDPKTQQIKRQANRQTSNVEDTPVSKRPAADNVVASAAEVAVEKPAAKPAKAAKAVVPPPPEDFDDNFVKTEPAAEPTNNTGLAAAIAKARSIKNSPTTETKTTVRKI